MRTAILVDDGGAFACGSLDDGRPPTCSRPVPLAGFDTALLSPDTPRHGAVRWLDVLELIVVRSADGFEVADGPPT